MKRFALLTPGRLLLALALMLGASASSAQETAARYWSDSWRGWHFYEEPMIEDQERPLLPDKAAPSAPPAEPLRAPELVEFERLQKTLEETRNIAIMRPTETNVRRYMELESQVVARASYFADVAQRVAWATPELDPTLQGRPVNAKALEVFEQTELADRSRYIAELAGTMCCSFSIARTAPTAMPSRRRWRPSRPATASRSWPSAWMGARCRASPTHARTTALPPP